MNFPISVYANRLKRAAFFIPFTGYFVSFVIIGIVLVILLNNYALNPSSSFYEIIFLLVKVLFFFAITILSLSLVLVLVSWIHFVYKKRKSGITLQIHTDKPSGNPDMQPIHLHINPILKPLLGFIKIRLQYDKQLTSPKFLLLESKTALVNGQTIEGYYNWVLPRIKEYQIEKVIVYFEDVFQFFSLAVGLPLDGHFFRHPVAIVHKSINAKPRKTEETNTRIEQMRKVEGEFLNYKNFENNDDVRRIVWKIYAKNQELVVRIPEIMDPYASHVYVYPSYHTSFDIGGNETVEVPFLNYYKMMTWSVYESLVKQGYAVKYITDQDVNNNNTTDAQQWVKQAISGSRWHYHKDLKNFVQSKNAAVVIISSLSNVSQVKDFAENYGREIKFVLVKLTDSFNQQNIADWLQWIFVENEQQDTDVFRRKWAMSVLKNKIKENEKRLEEIFKKYE